MAKFFPTIIWAHALNGATRVWSNANGLRRSSAIRTRQYSIYRQCVIVKPQMVPQSQPGDGFHSANCTRARLVSGRWPSGLLRKSFEDFRTTARRSATWLPCHRRERLSHCWPPRSGTGRPRAFRSPAFNRPSDMDVRLKQGEGKDRRVLSPAHPSPHTCPACRRAPVLPRSPGPVAVGKVSFPVSPDSYCLGS